MHLQGLRKSGFHLNLRKCKFQSRCCCLSDNIFFNDKIFFLSRVTTVYEIWIVVIKNIVPPVSAQVDFIKDLTQVALLTSAVGGPEYVAYFPTSFSSVVYKD